MMHPPSLARAGLPRWWQKRLASGNDRIHKQTAADRNAA